MPEVLILSKKLTNRHRPKRNIQFEDDKCEPHIKFTWREVFPRSSSCAAWSMPKGSFANREQHLRA